MRFGLVSIVLPLVAFAAAAVAIGWAPAVRVPSEVKLIADAVLLASIGALAYHWSRTLEFLRRAEEAYRSIFQDASDAILISGRKFEILDANAKACEILGYPREELLGRKLWDLLPPDEAESMPLPADDVLEKGRTVMQERRLLRSDGVVFTAEASARVMRDGRVIIIGRDVTERRKAEEVLKESEALARSVVFTAVDGIVTADEKGAIQSFNPAAERLFGYTAAELLGKPLSILMPPPYRERHEQFIHEFREGSSGVESGFGREVLAQRKDGVAFPVELAVSEMLLPGRRMFTAIIHDISKRKHAETVLEETNAKLQAVIETSPLAVIVFDFDSTVLSWNKAAERIFGWTPEEVIGQALPTVTAEQRIEFIQSLQSVARGEIQAGIERRRKRKDGTNVDITVWTAPLRNPEGEVTSVLAIGFDVTQSKALEEQFRHAQKMEAVGRLAGGIAHDFNNILTIITGYGQMALEESATDAQLRGQIEEILKASDHASSLTNQLLVFSRHQVGTMELVDLGEVVTKLERMLRRIIGEDVHLSTFVQEELGQVRADPGQIEQVIMNLAVNARDAMPGGGRLTIELANVELDSWYAATHMGVEAGDYVMLAISDTGKGIPPEARGRLFEPFFTTKERGKGTGLGLSTVYGIVKQSGGQIWVYSEVGRGTTFKVYLPRVMGEKPAAVPPPEPRAMRLGAETVLLVEDESGVRALVREILRQQGYKVLEAADVDDALRLCSEHTGRIHLLLTDVVMPIMSGRELAERAAAIRPDLKVLYMSGYTDNIVIHHGVNARDTQFIQKPFTPRLLARKIRDVLDQPE